MITINSVKRLSAASKKLTASLDRKWASGLVYSSLNSNLSDFSRYDHLIKTFIVLGHKDLLLDLIIENLEWLKITLVIKEIVSKEGLSKVDQLTLKKTRDSYDPSRFKDGSKRRALANILNDELIIDDVLNYLTKVCC